ncbi:sensor domain-containing protein [Streptomyces sp. NPDC001380]|uniref:sensor domain-containing protein n=1 Tax=Streptomyces sp. NPDC001380 TaxID=3364566 RepID=UPI0036C3BF1A
MSTSTPLSGEYGHRAGRGVHGRTASGAARRPPFWLAPVSGAAYREIGHALSSLPVAVAGFCFAVTLLSAGASLIVTVVGLPVLAALTAGARGLGALERARARSMLGLDAAAPPPVRPRRPGFWGLVTARLADAAGWRAVLYQVVMLPWAILASTVSLTFLVTGWVLALYPAYHWALARWTPWPGYRLFEYTRNGRHHEYVLASSAQITGTCLLGVALVLLTPVLVRGLANVSRLAVRSLLGGR